ncbi:MAG: SagB/ThcOx family dehydrogenase [candidate division KSB1 bacterium]|nr:SagB/ThcOx family dehydrogenase [candidate division KSB1 bacterium]
MSSLKLNPPDKQRGLPLMGALSVRASAREWSDQELSLQDLSDLLWAANGINRPDEKKRTAPSALNAQDIDLYVFMKNGVYLYNAQNHELDMIASGDYRSQIMMVRPPLPPGPPGTPPPVPPATSAAAKSDSLKRVTAPQPAQLPNPPIQIILVSDADRFRFGSPELRYEWGAMDAGIVSQNISLFCAATGLKTRPKASMDKEKIRVLLKLKDSQHIFLNHPVGYAP